MIKRGTGANPFQILLVEDNPADADLVRDALAEVGHPHRVTVVSDGEEAMRFLRRESEHAGARGPDLVLLDLNVPRKDGREVLAELRADPLLTHVPVVVLTSSEAERDVMYAYQLHANCVVSKPLGLEQFFHAIRALAQFWLSDAKLPPRARENPPASGSPPAHEGGTHSPRAGGEQE